MDQIIYHSFSITDFLMEHRIFYFYINKKEEQEACRNNFKFYSFIGVILYVFLELRVIIIYIHLSCYYHNIFTIASSSLFQVFFDLDNFQGILN